MASLTVGRVSGIPIRLHWSFLAVLPFFAFLMARAYFTPDDALFPDTSAWVWGSLLAVGLFLSVLVHELAHSLTALRLNVAVRHITLLPIGGVSAFDELPKDPTSELKITIVGPLTNFAMGLPLLAIAQFAPFPDAGWGAGAGLFLFWLGALNIVLGVFNLFVPAFPMDGGRILRAILARQLGRSKATQVAAAVGRTLAVAMGIWGFLTFATGGWLMLLIAFFIYTGANQEEEGIRVTEALSRFRVSDLMTRSVDTLARHDSVEDAFARMLRTRHVSLPVIDSGAVDARNGDAPQVLGVVRLDDLKVLGPEQSTTPMELLVRQDFPRLAAQDEATEAVKLLTRSPSGMPALVLDEGGGLVGIVTRTDVARFVEIANARTARSFGRGPAGGGMTG